MAKEKGTPVRDLVEGMLTEEGGETIRVLLQGMLNRLLDAELTEFLGAGPYERTEGRRGYRNGSGSRQLTTRLGELTLRVPRDREGKFSTVMFERYQRSERALQLGLAEMYVQGVSTRKVAEVTEVLFGKEFSASTVSNLAKKLDEEVEGWRERELEEAYPYLVVDAQYHKVREGGRVVSQGVLTVMGVDEEGRRRILDFEIAEGESERSWTELFRRLKQRGLKGVQFAVSDDHQGLRAAVRRCFVGAQWQRCQFHFTRNLRDLVGRKDQQELVDLLRKIWNATSRQEAEEELREVVEEARERWPRVAEKLEEEAEDTLAVFSLPRGHRRKLRTTNGLERLHEELRRRTRVVGIFPNRGSLARLVGALLIEQDEKWLTSRRYVDMALLREVASC
jgi:transposase-like protein